MVSIRNGARQTESPLLGEGLGQPSLGLGAAGHGAASYSACSEPSSQLVLLRHDRTSSLDYYEIRSNSSLERYDSIGPPFHCTFKVRRGF